MKDKDWFYDFDKSRNYLDSVFTAYGFDGEFRRLLEYRRRKQKKQMLEILRCCFEEIPTEFTTITDGNNPIGLQSVTELIK